MNKKLLRIITIIILLSILALNVNAGPNNPNIGPRPGQTMGEIRYSDIVTYINGYPIRSYNIDGNTWICVEDLKDYGFIVIWDSSDRILFSHVITKRK